MSNSNFVCVICDLKTPTLLALQEHTRAHAVTNKKLMRCKVSLDAPKSGDGIQCDVCPEVFETPTKAISHKFKKHPNSPNTYFCPWCGKQFPIKHILDKHKASHEGEEPDKIIPCDYCDTMFFQVSAVQYHITYFHKKEFMLANYIQTPPPSLKIVFGSSGEVHSAYYCQFCGNEYILKYNLQLHIKRVHMKDNAHLPPENLIRCKSCNALFYNVDAYEFHNTFHTEKDLYVDNEESRQQLVSKIDQDFDARRVRLNQERRRQLPKTKAQMKGISEYQEKLFGYIGNMSSLSPPPSDSESDEETGKEDQKEPAENAISIGEFFEMNKSLLGVDGNCEDIEIEGQEIVTLRKIKNKASNKKQKELETTHSSKHKKENKSELDEFITSKKKLYKKFKHVKFIDLKVNVERMDLNAAKNALESNQLAKITPIDLDKEKTNDNNVTSAKKKLIPVKSIPKHIQPLKLIRNIMPTSTQQIKTETEKYTICPSGKDHTKSDNGANLVKLPKNLIPVTSIPKDVKDVKVFKKVLIPKGTLKPGIQMLTKKDLDDLEKKGIMLSNHLPGKESGKVVDDLDKSQSNTVSPTKKLKMS